MNYLRHAWCLVAILLLGAPLLAKTLPGEPDTRKPVTVADLPPLPDEQTVPWGKEVDGLACRLVVAPEITHGQPIRAVVQVRNNSQRTRYLFDLFDIQFPAHAVLQITAPDGKPLRQSMSATTVVNPQRFVPIKPGEIRRFDLANVREYFYVWAQQDGKTFAVPGLGVEGKYSLTYTYRCPKCPERFVIGEKVTEKDGKRVTEKVYEDAKKEQLDGAWAGALTSNTLPVTVRPFKADDLAVHEWGVFTVFNDLKHANANRKAEWGSLPAEFYRQFPERRLRWAPAAWDKPIIYFYTKQPSLWIDVKVRFPEGAPVVWWPACADPVDDGMGRGMATPRGAAPGKVFDHLHWTGWLGNTSPRVGGLGRNCNEWVKVEEFNLPKTGWLPDARLKDAAPFTVVGSRIQRSAPWITDRPETERFIFYDGLVPAPDHLRCVRVTDKAVTVKNTAKFPLASLFLVDRRADRKAGDVAVAFRSEAIPPGAEVTIPTEAFAAKKPAEGAPLEEPLEKFAGTVRQALTGAGLLETEADSILKIWRRQFFESAGLTAFYLLPKTEYDRMLPLQVTPAPVGGPVRVGIALHPAFENGPDVRERVARLIGQLDAKEFAIREAATKSLEQLGPWAVPQLQEALKAKPSLETSRRLERLVEKADATEWLRHAVPAKEPAVPKK